ncbi:MAG TPA: SURF1 family cytochrome oxidase biogenesis protein, partial [Sphingopyxis sp.]|nr:SURF1 family cytochrome oxidase biogenesis protein [Sphingopyxis sp.]
MTDPAGPAEVATPGRRWPLIPTLFVAAAVAVMIGLGVWQLQRKADKEALIALYQRNMAMSS